MDKAGPDMVKAVLTRSLRNSNIRECRSTGVSFDNTGFQEHFHRRRTFIPQWLLGKKITYELGTSLSSTPQIPSVDAALFRCRAEQGYRQSYHKHVNGNVVVTECATNRSKSTALSGFLDQASKFVNRSLKERGFLDLCNRMLRVRKKTYLLTSKLSGTSSISDEQWEIEHTEMLACVASGAEVSRFVNIPRILKRNPTNRTG